MKGNQVTHSIKKTVSIILIMLGSVTAAAAQDGVIRGRAGISQNKFNTLWSGGVLESNFQSLNLGGTYILPTGWYYDAALKSSLNAKWTGGTNYDEPYKRQDYTLTIGKALADGFQVFGGYQQSNSNITLSNDVVEQFNIKGLFVGLGKTIPLSVGSVNLNAAIGAMSGRLLDGMSPQEWHDSKLGTGLSFGATYSYPLNSKDTLSFEYKNQSYRYELKNWNGGTAGDDKVQVFGVSIAHQF